MTIFIQNKTLKNFACNTISTMGAGWLASRYLPITVLQGTTISGTVGIASSIGLALAGEEAHTLKQVAIRLAILAATWFALPHFLPSFDQDLIVSILGFNTLGQITGSIFSKRVFASPLDSLLSLDKATSDQIKKLDQQHPNKKGLMAQLSPLMQQLVYRRFLESGFSPGILPETPTLKEIADLTDAQVRALYAHNVFFVGTESQASALLLRYFRLKLPYRSAFDPFMKDVELPKPQNALEILQWDNKVLEWYKRYYHSHTDEAWEDLPYHCHWILFQIGYIKSWIDNETYNAIAPIEQIKKLQIFLSKKEEEWAKMTLEEQKVVKKRCEEAGFPFDLPCHPSTPKEVQSLSKKDLEFFNRHLVIERYDHETVKALCTRFYQADLPLPHGDKEVSTEDATAYSHIEIPLPKIPEEVHKLTKNQMYWLYYRIAFNLNFKSFPIEVQWALNERLQEVVTFFLHVSTEKLSEANLKQASKNNLTQLEQQLIENPIEWICLPHKLQTVLKDLIDHPDLLATDLPKENVKAIYQAFKKHWHSWIDLSEEEQQGLNEAFIQNGLRSLPVTIDT